MKIYNELKSAILEKFATASIPAAGYQGRIVLDSTLTRVKVDTGAAWKELVDLNSAQQLTLKDYDGGTATDTSRITLPKETTTNLNALTRKAGTIVYDTTTSKPKFDNGSVLKDMGGGIDKWATSIVYTADNIIYNDSDKKIYQCLSGHTSGTFASDLASGKWIELSKADSENYLWNWKSIYAHYDDGSSAIVPVTGDGAGAGADLTLSLNTTDAMDGVSDLEIDKAAADARGEGTSWDLIVPKRAPGNCQTIKFNYYYTTAVPDGLFTVWIYKKDATTGQKQPTPYSLPCSLIPTEFKAEIQLDYDATLANCDDWRLELHCASTDATATKLRISGLEIGPTQYANGSPDVYLGEKTVTGSWTTNTTYLGKFWRSADRLKGSIRVSLSGAPDATELSITLPYTMDTNKLLSSSNDVGNTLKGQATVNDTGTGYYTTAGIAYRSSNQVWILYDKGDGTTARITNSLPITFANTDFITVYIDVPIQGWESSVQMSDSADTRVIAARYTATTLTTAIPNTSEMTILNFPNKVYDKNNAVTTGATWKYTAKIQGLYKVKVQLITGGEAWTALNYLGAQLYKNDSSYANLQFKQVEASVTQQIQISGTATVELNAGDWIDVRGFSSRTGGDVTSLEALNTHNYIEIEKISGPSQIAASEKVVEEWNSNAATTYTTASALIFEDIVHSSHGAYNPTTGRFTYPRSGKVDIKCTTVMDNIGGASYGYLNFEKNDSVNKNSGYQAPVVGVLPLYGTVSIYGNAGDYIDVNVYHDKGSALQFNGSAAFNHISFTMD